MDPDQVLGMSWAELAEAVEELTRALERLARGDFSDRAQVEAIADAALKDSPTAGRHMISGEDGQDHDPPEPQEGKANDDAD